MSKDTIVIGVLIEDTSTLSLDEVCQKYRIPQELLHEMIEYGFFANQPEQGQQVALDQKELRRIESAFRLHRDLEINLPGVALALDLLEEIEKMRHELDILRRHF